MSWQNDHSTYEGSTGDGSNTSPVVFYPDSGTPFPKLIVRAVLFALCLIAIGSLVFSIGRVAPILQQIEMAKRHPALESSLTHRHHSHRKDISR